MTEPNFVSTSSRRTTAATTTTATTTAATATTTAATTTPPSTIATSNNVVFSTVSPTPTIYSTPATNNRTSAPLSSLPLLPPQQSPQSFSSVFLPPPPSVTTTPPPTTTTAAFTTSVPNSSSSGSGCNNNNFTTTTTTTTTNNTNSSNNNNNNNSNTATKFHRTSNIDNENNDEGNQRQHHHHYNHSQHPPPYHNHHQYYYHHHQQQQQQQQQQYQHHRSQQYSTTNTTTTNSNSSSNSSSKFYSKPPRVVRTRMENTYGCSLGSAAAAASAPSSGVTAAVAAAAEITGGGDTDNNCSGLINEAGVDIAVHHNGPAQSTYERTGKSLHYNPKMAIAREFVLCALATYCSHREIGSPPACLDALGGTGLAGIQWKKYMGKRAHVTITDRNNLDLLEANCYRNSMLPKELSVDYSRAPGLPLPHQLIDEVFVQQISANVIMHLEAFDFIYIDSHGSCVTYLDAAFTNVRNNGLLCIMSSDLSALFAKTRHVAMRNYGANVIKNDYMKEAAVRVVVGAAARSAAKCSKGIQVMFGVCIEPFVLVIIKVQRGPYYADMCSLKVRPLVHCQICEERAFCTEIRASVDNLYNLLPCECQSENPGKTAVTLGPMWCDNIFNIKFVEQMIGIASDLKLSERLEAQLSSILSECVCSSSPVDSSSSSKHNQSSFTSSTTSLTSSSSPSRSVLLSFPSLSAQQHSERSSVKSLKHKSSSSSSCTPLSVTVSGNPTNSDNNINTNNSSSNTNSNNNNSNDITMTTSAAAATSVAVGPATSKNSTVGNGDANVVVDAKTNEMAAGMNGAVSVTIVSTSSDPQGNLKMDFTVDKSLKNCKNLSNEPPIKRICLPDPDPNPGLLMPPFFYNIHKRKFKGVFLPKLSKMVYLLQTEGFRASRTIFDSYSIRTNANQKDIYRTLLKYCKQDP